MALACVAFISSCKKDDSPKIDIVDEIEKVEEVEEVEPVDLSESVLRDNTAKLLLYNGDMTDLPKKIIVGEDIFETSETVSEFEKGTAYSFTLGDESYSLYKTELPIISINTEDREIVDEPKILGSLLLLENGEAVFESNVGVEIRGGFSQTFPKKSYSVELWKDEIGDDTDSEELLGMRKDDDWILDGLWNEPLRLRDYVSHDLWLELGRYPYKSEEPDVTFGIKREFCEVFINQKYRGLYYLGEKIDRKQLALKKYEDQPHGELYKGDIWGDGVLFEGLEDFSNDQVLWSGYEAEYPDEIGELDWTNLHRLVDFVVNNDQTTFDATISEQVSFENMADYFIFMNVIYAADNRGKNIFTGRYDNDKPYFFLAWDMDGSFGNDWQGERTDVTTAILSNGLYDKLLENPEFKAEVIARWADMRNQTLQVGELQKRFSDLFSKMKDNGVYERETFDAELPRNYSDEEINFIKSWIDRRITFLDDYFDNL